MGDGRLIRFKQRDQGTKKPGVLSRAFESKLGDQPGSITSSDRDCNGSGT
jgi:hypothetical protein